MSAASGPAYETPELHHDIIVIYFSQIMNWTLKNLTSSIQVIQRTRFRCTIIFQLLLSAFGRIVPAPFGIAPLSDGFIFETATHRPIVMSQLHVWDIVWKRASCAAKITFFPYTNSLPYTNTLLQLLQWNPSSTGSYRTKIQKLMTTVAEWSKHRCNTSSSVTVHVYKYYPARQYRDRHRYW